MAGLSSLAFAQPIYDVLRRAPEFFAIRQLYMGDLAALVALLAAGPTLALSAPALAARLVRPSWMPAALAAPVGLLSAVIALQAMHTLPAVASTCVASMAGVTIAWAHVRFQGVRSFASLLSVAAIVVPALLVLDGRVRQSATNPGQAIPADLGDTGARAPIVLVIFDEWSLTSILDSQGAIDRDRLPNLARLADQATWFPNTTAAADVSELAVPAMLTGSNAEQGRLPTLAERPVNLFTILAPSHEIFAVEPITSLCPANLNRLAEPRPAFGKRFKLLVSDLAVVWLNLTLPRAWAEGLPEVTRTWSGFGPGQAAAATAPLTDQPVQRALRHLHEVDRAAEFRRFANAIKPQSERPAFYFLHSLLPHTPWEYLPSGRSYRVARNRVHGLEREQWTKDPWPVRHHYRRYLLQVGFVDRLIGQLIDRLETLGLFDQTLIAITADHGVAFEPGRSRRLLDPNDPSGHQPLDLAAVPLIVKAPFQQQGAIDEAVTSLVELTPRLLELAGAQPAAAPRPRYGEEPSLVGKYVADIEVPVDRRPWRRGRLAEQARLLGAANDPTSTGIAPSLHGRRVDELPHRPGEIGIQLETAFAWDHIDPGRPDLPALVQGVFDSDAPIADRSVAVALNGVIAATLRPHQGRDGRSRIEALMPESLFRPGTNQIDVFLISGPAPALELEHVKRPPFSVYDLSRNARGQVAALLRRSRSVLDGDPEPIRLAPQQPDGISGFLDGGYERREGIQGWAVDVGEPSGIDEVVAFLGGRQFAIGAISFERPDVADRFGNEHVHSGFLLSETAQFRPDQRFNSLDDIREAIRREGLVVYAVSRRGAAARLRFSYLPLERALDGTEILPITDGRRLSVQRTGGGFEGAVDLVAREGKRTVIAGWAADLDRAERPRQVVIYRDGEFVTDLGANRERPDVAQRHNDPRLLRTGFRGPVPGAPDPGAFANEYRVFAVMLRGVAVELPYLVQPDAPP